jgi:hypothetical protein
MIKETEQPAREAVPDPVLAGYRLDPAPQRREGGSLLFSATAADGSRATFQVSAQPVPNRRARARFRRLARARTELEHAALVRVRETGEEGGRVFVATERFPARSLADLLRSGPLDPDVALGLLRAVADGLDAAHAAGLVHRTLSAESVLLDGDQVKLDLFGVFTATGLPSWGDVVRRDAHLHYESPEAVRGEELVPASNVYSLTGLLVHALTGEPPFPHHDPVMITYAHVSQPPPKLSERRPELPARLDAVVARGMAKEPGERPASGRALIADAATALRMVSRVASYGAPKPVAPKLAVPESAPVPKRPPAPLAPRAVPPSLPLDDAGPHGAPLRARLATLGPVLLVLVVAAAFGALLGMPGGGSQQAASTVRSPDELAVQQLDGVRFRLRDDLAFASTADAQAAVAQRLAMAYGRAADHVSSPELVAAAQRASAAYVSLERAARAGDENAYESARGRVEVAESQVASALAPNNSQTERK